ncbi:NIPSNAP family protein [Embleya sp. NBC_00896]|uniref:NIPSNAP family protein n=1 Tax=Embleya sp. NBC_00896 TaxID=2975961 RepID=UPI00386B2C1F|nr:NIPSNAP family protein [Embleya sp. NBC_00896]
MSTDDEVHILDHVTLTNDQVALWLGQFHDRYLPGAQRRGMRLERVWRSPSGRDATTVHILWALPGIRAFYAMRGAAAADPSVAAFWAATDGYAVDRQRRALQPTLPLSRTAADTPARETLAHPSGASA